MWEREREADESFTAVVQLISVLGIRNPKYFPIEMQVICTDWECGVNDMHHILNLYEPYPPKFIKSSNRPYTKAAEPSYCTVHLTSPTS